MVAFTLDSNQYFVHSYNSTSCLAVHELEPFFSNPVKEENWKFIATVGQELDYNELRVFDVSIHGKALTDLVEDLNRSRLIVNREGYCFLNTKHVCTEQRSYYRINDLFGWTKYGVSPVVTTIWNRCDMETGKVCVNHVREKIKLKKLGKQVRNLRGEVDESRGKMEKDKEELDVVKKELEKAREDLSAEREHSKDLVYIVATLKEMIVELKKET